MSDLDRPMAPPAGPIALVARGLAFMGGVSLLVAASITTVSVLLRWLTNFRPVKCV